KVKFYLFKSSMMKALIFALFGMYPVALFAQIWLEDDRIETPSDNQFTNVFDLRGNDGVVFLHNLGGAIDGAFYPDLPVLDGSLQFYKKMNGEWEIDQK